MRKITVPEMNPSLFRQAAFDARRVDQGLSGMLHEAARYMECASVNQGYMLPSWFCAEMLAQGAKATSGEARKHLRAWATLRGAVEAERDARRDAEAAGRTISYEEYRLVRDNPSMKGRFIFMHDNAGVWWLPKDDAAVRAAIEAARPKAPVRRHYEYETRF